ncbi:hypothetical protein [Nocardioides houyundeii]|nr:hypothetical protein [Nocardioides houyundeii]
MTFFSWLGPVIAGALLGILSIIGLVWSQTQPPAENPAQDPVLNYGDRR